MNNNTKTASIDKESKKPLNSQDANAEEQQEHYGKAQKQHPTVNSGDRIDESKSIEQKAQQVAVDSPDITGENIAVPTYFVAENADGEQQALHHIKDAEEISDVIRQARVNEDGEREWR